MTGANDQREISIEMDDYISELEPLIVDKQNLDRVLTEAELTVFKSQLLRVRWPVHRLCPELAYGVSALSQGAEKKVVHMAVLNDILARLHSLHKEGSARIVFRKTDLSRAMVVTIMDASFANEAGKRSQMGLMNIITESTVNEQSTIGNLVEFQSSTIQRVVRSTLAAESASLSTALDRGLYCRLLLECFLYGEPAEYAPDWRHKLKVPGVTVTDAKSLHDHLGKTGSVPEERQVLIDLLAARDLCEDEVVKVRWLPNQFMLADILTKAVRPNLVTEKFLRKGLFCLVPTQKQQDDEDRRLALRRGQRERAKERKAARAGQPLS